MLESRRVPGLIFADDLALLADTPENVQSTLNTLYMYCEKWALKFNMKKKQTLVFGHSGQKLQSGTTMVTL